MPMQCIVPTTPPPEDALSEPPAPPQPSATPTFASSFSQGNVATDEQMLRTGLNVHGSVDSAGCSRVFFGKDGKGLLPMAKFESWLRELNEEMVKMEFQHYDSHQRKGKLDPRDFALSLISAACPKARLASSGWA